MGFNSSGIYSCIGHVMIDLYFALFINYKFEAPLAA